MKRFVTSSRNHQVTLPLSVASERLSSALYTLINQQRNDTCSALLGVGLIGIIFSLHVPDR